MKLKRKIYGIIVFFAPLSLMAADSSQLKSGMSTAMGVGAIIAFLLCFFFFIAGVLHHHNGGDFSKDIIGVVVTAASGAICSVIFVAFGMGDAVLTPTF